MSSVAELGQTRISPPPYPASPGPPHMLLQPPTPLLPLFLLRFLHGAANFHICCFLGFRNHLQKIYGLVLSVFTASVSQGGAALVTCIH